MARSAAARSEELAANFRAFLRAAPRQNGMAVAHVTLARGEQERPPDALVQPVAHDLAAGVYVGCFL